MDIKLKDFEGPLDLLLHLVSKYQMDIYDVPITEVIEQYLAYVSTLQAMRLEIAGEYMVMASQLMLIKSRKLLPKVAEVTDWRMIWSRIFFPKSKNTASSSSWESTWKPSTKNGPSIIPKRRQS